MLNPRYGKRSIGIFTIERKAQLPKLIPRHDEQDPRGPVTYDPRIYSCMRKDGQERYFWFPYWITIHDKKQFGQFSQITPEDEFLELVCAGIKNGLFSDKFVSKLKTEIEEHG